MMKPREALRLCRFLWYPKKPCKCIGDEIHMKKDGMTYIMQIAESIHVEHVSETRSETQILAERREHMPGVPLGKALSVSETTR